MSQAVDVSPRPRRGIGAACLPGGRCHFTVWAPQARRVDVRILGAGDSLARMEKNDLGHHQVLLDGVGPGTQYFYLLDGKVERPDPASRYQPLGVHGPSQVVDPDFPWEDYAWRGLPLKDFIIYELHVGAFTPKGTFESIVPHLDGLKELGITAIELMPVAQFPGSRNWGYDGVNLFAVQDSYGGPEGLKGLVNACHQKGLAVVLDVVYNHLGPEGNYLSDFGPYFTERYQTPWGAALNFDGPGSDHVRRFFIENALYWTTECHVDALRLDAVHAILDHSPYTFLEELVDAVSQRAEELDRRIYLVAESADNDARLIRSRKLGGYGLDAQWSDDFHHCLHTLLTGEREGYYQDYGKLRHLAKAFREGFVYSGEYSPYRQRKHGTSSRHLPAQRLVVCAQNHDQVGNRMLGERLSQLVSFEALKLAAGTLLLSPFLPLLFMGEEYGETAPFPYFISHTDPELVEAVRRGRQEEFAAFQQRGEPLDPQAETTFQRAKLDHSLPSSGRHHTLRGFYQELIRLRKEVCPLSHLSKDHQEVVAYEDTGTLVIRRWAPPSAPEEGDGEVVVVLHFGTGLDRVSLPMPPGTWRRLLDSAEERWAGPGSSMPQELDSPGSVTLDLSPQSLVMFHRSSASSHPSV